VQLPLDRWQDDETDRGWLPAFVMPRDPAVLRIVDAAQRYLVALTDRMDAGFVGYQPAKDSPPGSGHLQSPVDTQVRALWWAMLSKLPLSYIYPPPTLSAKAQRVRSRQLDVGPDGRFLINAELNAAAAPITLLQNWHPEAKK
jgi:hypothetical protein